MSAVPPPEVVWHDIECGRYAADLALWRSLASESPGPVLELGCGTGRVALDLAAAGHAVTGLDRSPALAAALADRAREAELDVRVEVGDARELALSERFAAILLPMQLIHLLGGPGARRAALDGIAAHLTPGGTCAVALLPADLPGTGDGGAALPDVAEHDGWVYSSLPVEVRADGSAIELRRLRQAVSPQGELREELDSVRLEGLDADRLEAEARASGLVARERIPVPPTDDHVGSVVCVLEAR